MKRGLLIACLLCVAVPVGAYGGWRWMQYQLDSPLKVASGYSFTVRNGDTLNAVAKRWQQEGLLVNDLWLRLAVRLDPALADIQAGRYALEPGISVRDATQLLREGRVELEKITLIEGWSAAQMVQAVQAHDDLIQDLPVSVQTRRDGTAFLNAAALSALAEHLNLSHSSAEGWLYPDTYQFAAGTSATELLRLTVGRMQQTLAQSWSERELTLPLASPYEMLILASIVEKESGVRDERPHIAGVFTRRLQQSMRLQTDPTVIYGIGQNYDGDIRRKDLNTTTAFNTYRIDGLPPTPIASPGIDALHAVAKPAAGTALFFVASGNDDGRHVFSDTREEHERAVAEYLKRLRQR
ncbi:MAG: endolytic transglycosylase MltG [Pseudomonadota bacterium]